MFQTKCLLDCLKGGVILQKKSSVQSLFDWDGNQSVYSSKRTENPAVTERGKLKYCDNGESLLEGIHSVALCCTHEKFATSICIKNKNREC